MYLGYISGVLRVHLWTFRAHPGALLVYFKPTQKPLKLHSGCIKDALEVHSGTFWVDLGCILGAFKAHLGAVRDTFGALRVYLWCVSGVSDTLWMCLGPFRRDLRSIQGVLGRRRRDERGGDL